MKKLFAFSFSIVFLSLLILLIATCSKEYSYEGGPPAVFILSGAPDTCTNFTINGTYYTGIITDSNNTVVVTADVTTTGSYSITTNGADGISFSAAGTFTDTGYQPVVLSCSGTPAASGSFGFAVPGDNGCSFSLEVIDRPPADYILSGSPNDCQDPTISGDYAAAKVFFSSNNITINVSVISTGKYQITTDTVDGVSFSDSGNFTTTGDQQIILTGNGTPSSSGLIYFTLHAPSSQCSFTIPIRSADPLATYVLQSGASGTSDVCTPQSIQGIYTANMLLNSTNTITITAYVTIPGNYTLSTGRFNGIEFESSGAFTTTGLQSVILYGNGTPTEAGTFTYVPQIIGPDPIGGNVCDVDIIVQ